MAYSREQADYKRGECLVLLFLIFYMSLFARGIIHQGLDPELFSNECRGRREAGFICVWALHSPIRK